MADDPKKKQQQAPVEDPSQMSYEEFKRRLDEAKPESTGASGGSGGGADWGDDPVAPFWQRLIHGVEGKSRLKEIGRSAVRGVAEAANEVPKMLNAAGSAMERQLTGTTSGAFSDDATKAVSEAIDTHLGARSDDPIASFAESTSQFLTGWEATGPMKGLKLGKVATAMARGAVVDATAFDPYEAQLAELAAKAPEWAGGIKQLGQLLSVEGDDSQLVARIKRSAAGVLTGAAIEGLVAIARWTRSGKQLADPKVTGVAREAALETHQAAEETLQAAKEGTLAAPEDHVAVKPVEDGFVVEPVQSRVQAGSTPVAPVYREVSPSGAIDFIGKHLRPIDEVYFATTPDLALGQGANKGVLIEADPTKLGERLKINKPGSAFAAANGGGEEFIVRGHMGDVYHDAMRSITVTKEALENQSNRAYLKGIDELHLKAGWKREMLPEGGVKYTRPESPVFPDRGEAEARAAGINMAVAARKADVKVTPELVQQHMAFADQLLKSEKPEDVARLAEGTHFNMNYTTRPDDIVAQVESMSEQVRARIDAAQGKPEGVRVEEMIAEARRIKGAFTSEEFPKAYGVKADDVAGLHAWQLAGDMALSDYGKQGVALAERLAARPDDSLLLEEARGWLGRFYHLGEKLAGSNSEIGRALRALQERDNALLDGAEFKQPGAEAAKPEAAPKTPTEKPEATKVAGMTPREIRTEMRMVKMAQGKPRNIYAVVHGAKVIRTTGSGSKAMEVFANFLLSGLKTGQTVLVSGAGTSLFEPIARIAGGLEAAARGEVWGKALAREGADIMWGNFKYLGDNLRSMVAALDAGHSIINPQPQHIAFDGTLGEAIRMPGRLLLGLDEFVRVTNYRSFVRAKSLRLAREEGLTGAALERRVDEDLRAAFDKDTGIARLPDALRYAETPTFSGPLGTDTFGGAFQEFVNNRLEAKFVAPFVKASTNIFRYVWQSAPGLNLLNKRWREVIKQGGEEAAVIHARSAIAGTVYGYSVYQALQGNLTGRGPVDPKLRALWLKDNKPYSIKVNGEWTSYRRADPLGTPLGLIADFVSAAKEMHDSGEEVNLDDAAFATVASIVQNLSSKTYMQGITRFFGAWTEGDKGAVERWTGDFLGSLAVPTLVSSLNPDDTYRDATNVLEMVMARVPGFSKTLPPRFDIFGEPVMKDPSLYNRAVEVFPSTKATQSVESKLYELGAGFSPMGKKLESGKIDMTDVDKYGEKGKPSPYVRLMEIISTKGARGSQPLRKDIEDYVNSEAWKNDSDGTADFPGGKRWIHVASLKNAAEQRALKQVREEYPKLRQAIEQVQRVKGAAIRSGETGVAQVEALFGTSK